MPFDGDHDHVLAFRLGPYQLGIELRFLYQVVPAGTIEPAGDGLYRFESMPVLILDDYFPIKGRGEAYVISWYEDAVGCCRVDEIYGLLRIPHPQRYPIPISWLKPDHGWVRAVFFSESIQRPVFILNVISLLRAAQLRVYTETG